MGSKRYLITEFLAPRTNPRTDRFGGSLEKRARIAVDIVRRTRARLGPDFLIVDRISAIGLVEGRNTGAEISAVAGEPVATRAIDEGTRLALAL